MPPANTLQQSTRSREPTSRAQRCDPEIVAKAKAFLIGCYPDHGKVDPQIYNRALGELMGAYPREVVEAAVNPVTGLPSRSKWLPSISEVSDELKRQERRLAPETGEKKPPSIEKQISPAEQRRVGEKLRQLSHHLRNNPPGSEFKPVSAELFDETRKVQRKIADRAIELGGSVEAWERAHREFEMGVL